MALPTEPDLGPYFCDVEEKRSPTAVVFQWRLENDRDELLKDAKTNTTIEEECP